jgi:hypothetical protein
MKGILHGGIWDGTEVELGDPPLPPYTTFRGEQYTRQLASPHYHYAGDGPNRDDLVLGWDGKRWAYATPARWQQIEDGPIVPACLLLGDLPGLDDPARPPRCDGLFEGQDPAQAWWPPQPTAEEIDELWETLGADPFTGLERDA